MKFFNLETKKEVFLSNFEANANGFILEWEHKQLKETAINFVKEMIKIYGINVNELIFKNQNCNNYIQQGFNFYTFSEKDIKETIYKKAVEKYTTTNYYQRLIISYIMKIVTNLSENSINRVVILNT